VTARYVAQQSTRGPRVKDRQTGSIVYYRTQAEADEVAATLNADAARGATAGATVEA